MDTKSDTSMSLALLENNTSSLADDEIVLIESDDKMQLKDESSIKYDMDGKSNAEQHVVKKEITEEKKEKKEEYEERLVTASSVEELIKLIKAAYSEKSDDRFEKSDKNDDALKIDRVDFSGGKSQPAYEQYVPSAVPEEKHPFDFKA